MPTHAARTKFDDHAYAWPCIHIQLFPPLLKPQSPHTVLTATAVTGAADLLRLEALLEDEVIESIHFLCLVGVYL